MKSATAEKVAPFKLESFKAAWPVRRALVAFAIVMLVTLPVRAQTSQSLEAAPDGQPGQILGTVTDVRGDAVAGAAVLLKGPAPTNQKIITTGDNGFFEFDDVKPSVSYQVVIRAMGFAQWTSSTITLTPGQVNLISGVTLQLETQNTTVTVSGNPIEIATEQIKLEETQRVFGFIPNFYVSYEGQNAAPLTAKMKFKLALKVSYDPVTIGGVALVAAFRQAARSPDYREGWIGYAERFGSTGTDGLTDIMIGGAILPSLLHQDPRYFYKGTGGTGPRLRHALLSPFVTRGDNGRWQPNYSSMGGDLASGAIANLYFPKSSRGVGLVFSQFAIGTGEREIATVVQEFLLAKVTHRGGHVK